MKRLRFWGGFLSLAILVGCFAPAVDMAIIAVLENDNKRVEKMPPDEEMAYKPTRVAVIKSDTDYKADLQQALADGVSQAVSPLPGTEVVYTEEEADWVLRPEISDASTSVKKTGDHLTITKWQLTGRVRGKIEVTDKKTGAASSMSLNASKNKTFGTRQASQSSSQKSNLLRSAAQDAARKQKSALKRKFPMPMYIIGTKGARQYVKLNRGRIHKTQKRQRLEMVNSVTGESVPGKVRIIEVNEETSWGKTDPSARIGALVGLKCVPVGR